VESEEVWRPNWQHASLAFSLCDGMTLWYINRRMSAEFGWTKRMNMLCMRSGQKVSLQNI
jgi:hypothetical protein